ncbi:MAG: Transaldolase [Phycisphaerae bacterium]|nr:Transaldolase [Phycisphaerae bacterium]
MTNRIRQLSALGQAVWLDYISREMVGSGELQSLVEQGISGVTSNPTIFQKSIAAGREYESAIRGLSRAGRSAAEIYETLIVDDIRAAADQLRPVYNETHGRDGFVSIEVSPKLAHDARGTVVEARRLAAIVARPNVMIKVPGTEQGLTAIETLIGEGLNVNVTLIFSTQMYERVMQAYRAGLKKFAGLGRPLGSVSSVASFFVSRVDTLIDAELAARTARGEDGLEGLAGLAANANAKIAYAKFKAFFLGEPFAELRAMGARVQRPLWASTSTKNPAYPDTKYVDPLIGPNTVNTVPPATLAAILDHATVAHTIDQELDAARAAIDRLAAVGIDMEHVTAQLLVEGVASFDASFEQLLRELESRRVAALPAA